VLANVLNIPIHRFADGETERHLGRRDWLGWLSPARRSKPSARPTAREQIAPNLTTPGHIPTPRQMALPRPCGVRSRPTLHAISAIEALAQALRYASLQPSQMKTV
jgi:hypothetical protein